jgi:hypothetical protein
LVVGLGSGRTFRRCSTVLTWLMIALSSVLDSTAGT